MAKANHRRILRQTKLYLMPGEPLKQPSQRNQMTYLQS